jgi:hypothetical protein
MSKLNLQKLFLKDNNGRYFRICSFSNPKDKQGEYYLKMIFHDIGNLPMIGSFRDKDNNITGQEFMPGGIHEFTYHYWAGVSHYKNSSEGYVDSAKNLPTIKSFPAVHLLRCTVYDLKDFSPFNKNEISTNDLVVKRAYNGRPRGFEFFVSKDPEVIVKNEWTKGSVDLYKIDLEDKDVYFFIADGVWLRNPMGLSGMEIFRYDDPTRIFDVIN